MFRGGAGGEPEGVWVGAGGTPGSWERPGRKGLGLTSPPPTSLATDTASLAFRAALPHHRWKPPNGFTMHASSLGWGLAAASAPLCLEPEVFPGMTCTFITEKEVCRQGQGAPFQPVTSA